MTLETPSPDELGGLPQRSALPLQSSLLPRNNGWAIRLAVRAEHVEVEKQLVVYEQAIVRRYAVEDTERIEATLRREELRIDDE
jgi:uncharacterized protein (TIGR02271 family)